jgi:hypothetical protein
MALQLQLTDWTSLATANKRRVKLVYATGTFPVVLTTIHEGECFMTALSIHNENGSGANVTIQEFDGSNYFWKEYNVKANEFIQIQLAAAAQFNARKFYSGVSVLSNKTNVHFQLRAFVREV